MKKFYNYFSLLAILALSPSISQAQYCPSICGTTADEEIYNFMINGAMTNPLYSFANGCTTPAPGPGSALSRYSNFTTLGSLTNLTVGNVVTFSVAENECDGPSYYNNGIGIWIDYNQNGLFTDPGEQIYMESLTTISPRNITATTTIPFSASFGPTVLRIICAEGYSGTSLTPCLNGYGYGETEDYSVTIIPSTPCSSTPGANTVLPISYSTCPGLQNPALTLANTYTVGGITYQWQSSTVSPVGPFNAIPGATLYSAPLPTLGITTWFQVVATCTNTGGSYTTASSQFYVAGTTTNSVPYYEDFEGIQGPDRLPNCSWWANNIGTTVRTYTAAASNNRVPNSGSNFGAFSLPSNNNIVYSNGIQLDPGITYSAAINYATEYFGYNNWTNLSIMLGTSQTPAGLVQVASTSPAISGPYKVLGNTFTVASSGLYYIAIKATAISGSALYLMFDDLSVTIPCTPASGNSPTISLNASSSTICAGDQVSLNATGASGYLWSNGATSANIVVSPLVNTAYSVIGTNLTTGCSETLTQLITVNPSPTVFIVASSASICPGDVVYLTGYGASSYAWSSGGVGGLLTVSPLATTNYSVIGTNAFGCSSTGSQLITVKTPPTISAISSNLGDICVGEPVTLTGSGGVSYTWYSSSSAVLYSGNPVVVFPNTSSTFTVVGIGANGCSNKTTVNQNVAGCVGLEKNSNSASGIKLYPNPAHAMFTIESVNGVSSVEVTDIAGRVVMVLSGNSEKLTVDISALSSGIYYAKITSANVVEIVKVVKQ